MVREKERVNNMRDAGIVVTDDEARRIIYAAEAQVEECQHALDALEEEQSRTMKKLQK